MISNDGEPFHLFKSPPRQNDCAMRLRLSLTFELIPIHVNFKDIPAHYLGQLLSILDTFQIRFKYILRDEFEQKEKAAIKKTSH